MVNELDPRLDGRFSQLYNRARHPFVRSNKRAPYFTRLLENVGADVVRIDIRAGRFHFLVRLHLENVRIHNRGQLRLNDLTYNIFTEGELAEESEKGDVIALADHLHTCFSSSVLC